MKKKPATTIMETDNESSVTCVTALEELLMGLAHGDITVVKNAIGRFGQRPEINRPNEKVPHILQSFHETVSSFRARLDPATLTMTSTNIPDATKKLKEVLSSTNEATHKLFALVERQEALLDKGDAYLSELEASIQQQPAAALFVKEFANRYRNLNAEARGIATEMVMTQEFQDLCGQSLKKVLILVQGLESQLVSLLTQLKVEVPPPQLGAEPTRLGQQDDVDNLLEDLGF
jgi:chemotaxis regulatin CheY-phosphate phosphatase CheZ